MPCAIRYCPAGSVLRIDPAGEMWSVVMLSASRHRTRAPRMSAIALGCDGMPAQPRAIADIRGARVLCLLADSITTDHISPAGSIRKTLPAGQYLIAHGIEPIDFNSYGARRGNHEVMVRGTFANVRLKNKLAPDTEGPWTR